MLDRSSALAGYGGPNSADGPSPVTFAPRAPGSAALVTAFPPADRAVRTSLKKVTGFAPPKIGRFAEDATTIVAALAPGRFLALSGEVNLVQSLGAAIATARAAVTDLSHARTLVTVAGESSASLLAKGVMLDLSAQVFPPGSTASTVVHHIDITLLRRGETTFDLVVYRGFAVSLMEWLADAAAETGFRLREPE